MLTRMDKRNTTPLQHPSAHKALLGVLISALIAPLLTACTGTINSPNPLPPISQQVYLSSKYESPFESLCATTAVCPGMTDFNESDRYYQAIGAEPTLTQWKNDWGFNGANPIYHASYGNQADLQLGRDMYCTTSGQTVACYVSNYGQPPFLGNQENVAWPNVAQAVNDVVVPDHNQTSYFATVAMVYTPTPAAIQGAPSGANNVTFYVYDGKDNLLNQPALDGQGPKSVPRMCMVCHGGTYVDSTRNNTTTGAPPYVTGAAFLPFDTGSFKYDPSLLESQQQEAFRNLNATVLATNPPLGVNDFINGLYCSSADNVTANNPNANCRNSVNQLHATTFDGYIPPGWCPSSDPTCQNANDQSTLYKSVVKTYCRMCHLAGQPDFTKYSDFTSLAADIETLVCNSAVMPQAEVPFGDVQNINMQNNGIGFWWDPLGTPGRDLQKFLNGQSITQTHNCTYQ